MNEKELNIVDYEVTQYLKKTIPNYETLNEETQVIYKVFLLVTITYKVLKMYDEK